MNTVNGKLASNAPVWRQDASAVTVVLASAGYPGSYRKGVEISGEAGVRRLLSGVCRLLTARPSCRFVSASGHGAAGFPRRHRFEGRGRGLQWRTGPDCHGCAPNPRGGSASGQPGRGDHRLPGRRVPARHRPPGHRFPEAAQVSERHVTSAHQAVRLQLCSPTEA